MYLSCRYATATEPQPTGQQAIVCVDENGTQWSLTENSQVGDYLAFLDAGGTIEPAKVPVDSNILAAPKTLFGGPTIRETFSGQ